MARGARARRGIRADDARESETRSIRVVADDGGADGAENVQDADFEEKDDKKSSA